MDSRGEWGGAPLPPSPFLAGRKGTGVFRYWHINGAPGQGEAPLPDAEGYPRGGDSPTLPEWEGQVPPYGWGLLLRVTWKVGALPRWVLPHPRICCPVLGSGDPGQDPLQGVEAGMLGLSRARAMTGLQLRWLPKIPGATPLQPGPDTQAWGFPEPTHCFRATRRRSEIHSRLSARKSVVGSSAIHLCL